MSQFVVISPTLWVDEFAFTSLIHGVPEQVTEVDQVERPRADGGGFRHYLPGLVNTTGSFSGSYDPEHSGIQDLVPANRAATRLVTSTPQGSNTEGDPLFSHRGLFSSFEGPAGDVGTLAMFNVQTQSTDPPVAGYVGVPAAEYDDNGFTGDGINIAGPSAGESLYAVLHVYAADGTDLEVVVESDDNDTFSSATERITFSTVSAVSAQWDSVAGDLSSEDYWRVVVTIASGDFSLLCGFGIA